jgi:Uma2 family endonuclease
MADPAQRRMTVEEFLAWDGEGDTRYQLQDGVPVALAPPAEAHSIMAGTLAGLIHPLVSKRPPCTVRSEAGRPSPSSSRSFHQGDIVVTCSPAQRGRQETPEPLPIIEILSPSTLDDDRRFKLPDYRMLPSVQEVVMIDSRFCYCEVHRRGGSGRWVVDLMRRPDDQLRLETVGLDVPLSTIYANIPLEEAS